MWIILFAMSLFLASPLYAGQFDPPVGIQDEGGTESKPVFTIDCVGAGISCTQSGITGTLTVSGGNSFETVDVPAGTDPVADSSTDTLVITETDTPLVITGTSGTDTIDITTIDCAANEIMKRNAGDTAWACAADSGGGSNPAGSGSELQFRSDATTFGAVTSSSVSGAEVTFAGDVSIGGFAGAQLNIQSLNGDQWGLHTENGPSGGSSWWGNTTDARHFWQADGAGSFYLPQNTSCDILRTASDGKMSCGPANADLGSLNLPVTAAKLPATNPCVIDNSSNNALLLCDATTAENAFWQFVLPPDYGGGPQVRVLYSMASATTGGVSIDVSAMATTPGDAADINTNSYGNVSNCDDGTVPGTAGYLDLILCTIGFPDGMASGDLVKIDVQREVTDASDTATGDMELYGVILEYTKS